MTPDKPLVNPVQRTFSINRTPIIDIKELMTLLGDQDLQIWDARSEAEFNGTTVYTEKQGIYLAL
jgi:3-mercaptopyruvate sulfurtransferase SseA